MDKVILSQAFLTSQELAKEGAETGCSESTSMDYDVSSKVEQRGMLTGMLLGVARRDQNNFYIQHSSNQRDYILFKKVILERITRKPVELLEGKGKNYPLRIEPSQIPLIRVLIKRLYRGKQKVISRSFLDYLTPPGIAIWFMDFGSKSFRRKNGKIHALEVTLNTHTSKEENELIIAYFLERWGFQWGLSRTKTGYRLRMGTQEGKRFFQFLSPYIHPSMLYKIQSSYNITTTT